MRYQVRFKPLDGSGIFVVFEVDSNSKTEAFEKACDALEKKTDGG